MEDETLHPSKSILRGNTISFLTNKRRVSFAPEVTLHKFDFVPYQSTIDLKRRRTIGDIPLQESDGSIENDDSGLPILHDSSDEEKVQGEDDEEQTMELTGQIQVPTLAPVTEATTLSESSDEDEEVDMEITEARKLPVMQDPDTEVTMELTNLYVPQLAPRDASPKLELNSPIRRLSIANDNEPEQTMEFTEVVTRIQETHEDHDESHHTMEFTSHELRIEKLSQIEEQVLNTNENVEAEIQEPEQQTESNDNGEAESTEIENNAMELTVTSNTVLKPEEIPDQLQEEEGGEIGKTIIESTSQEYGSQPMQITQENRRLVQDTPSNIETHVSTTTIPLAELTVEDEEVDDDENENDEEDDYEPITLNEFMNDIGVKFYDDLDIDISSIKRLSTTGEEGYQEDDFIRALPRLELLATYQFSCTELNKNIMEGRKVFAEFNETIATNNPQLFRDYYLANDLERLQLNAKLHLVKDYTRHQSKITWYAWRTQLTENLLHEMRDRYEEFNNDKQALTEDLARLDHIYADATNLAITLKEKLENLVRYRDQLNGLDANKIRQLKLSLLKSRDKLAGIVEEIDSKTSELKKLNEKLADNKKEKAKLHQDIANYKKTIANLKKYNEREIKLLKFKSNLLLRITGTSNIKTVDNVTELHVNNVIYAKIEDENVKYDVLDNVQPLYNEPLVGYITLLLSDLPSQPFESFKELQQRWGSFKTIDEDFYRISLKFPVQFLLSDDSIFAQIRYFNIGKDYKVVINVEIQVSDIVIYPNNVKVSCEIKRSNGVSSDHIKGDLVKDVPVNSLLTRYTIDSITFA